MSGEGLSVWTSPGYGAWLETALNPPESLKTFSPEIFFILLDSHFPEARPWNDRELDAAVRSLGTVFPGVPVIVPDVTAIAADFGGAFYDERLWKLGGMPFSLAALRELAKLFVPKKVLALDLDGTLWRGVVGEDGADGIEPDTAFQKRVLAIKNRGILLAAVSKNNAADVEPVWKDSRMVLKREDFVVFAANWEPKGGNLERLAAELNLGLDSFVFVDDNPAERAEMRARCPAVCVAEFPPRLEAYFPDRPLTAEDTARTELYQAESARKEFAAGLSYEEYLAGLAIENEIHPVREDEFARAAQLSAKTNQFNVRTCRYTEADLRRFAADPDCVFLTLRSKDRFGDQGLVAYALAKGGEILDFVMSCRAMNRRIEYALEAELERRCRERGIGMLRAVWIRTGRNAPTEMLFEDFGFEPVSREADRKVYRKSMP